MKGTRCALGAEPRHTRMGYHSNQPPEPCSHRDPTKKRGNEKKKKERKKPENCISVSAEVGGGGLHCCISS